MARDALLLFTIVACVYLAAAVADDRAALMDLFDATNGINWVHNAGWGTQVRRSSGLLLCLPQLLL